MHFVEVGRAQEEKPEPNQDIHRAYAVAAIQAAVSFLEAAINELFQDAADGYCDNWPGLEESARRGLAGVWTAIGGERERFALKSKVKAAVMVAGAQGLDVGAQLYQRFAAVLEVRNELTHYKPRTQSNSMKDKLSTKLKWFSYDRNPLTSKGNPEFPDQFLGAGGAQWAVESCRMFADEFFRRLGVTPHYAKVLHGGERK